jgi:hypothetical protein
MFFEGGEKEVRRVKKGWMQLVMRDQRQRQIKREEDDPFRREVFRDLELPVSSPIFSVISLAAPRDKNGTGQLTLKLPGSFSLTSF